MIADAPKARIASLNTNEELHSKVCNSKLCCFQILAESGGDSGNTQGLYTHHHSANFHFCQVLSTLKSKTFRIIYSKHVRLSVLSSQRSELLFLTELTISAPTPQYLFLSFKAKWQISGGFCCKLLRRCRCRQFSIVFIRSSFLSSSFGSSSLGAVLYGFKGGVRGILWGRKLKWILKARAIFLFCFFSMKVISSFIHFMSGDFQLGCGRFSRWCRGITTSLYGGSFSYIDTSSTSKPPLPAELWITNNFYSISILYLILRQFRKIWLHLRICRLVMR